MSLARGLLIAAAIGVLGLAPARLSGSAEPAPESACPVELVPASASAPTLRVKVGAREVDLGPFDQEPRELQVYPDGAGAVLVAYRGSDGDTPYGGSTLWRVSCAAGPAERFADVEGADFGHSALSEDGRTLFFTGPDGIFALDLATRATRRLTRAASSFCAKNAVQARDVVDGLDRDHALRFERGCRYAFAWNAQAMRLEDPSARRAQPSAAPRPPLAALAVDAGGGLWLSDGLCSDAATFGRVLFSADAGEHWREIAIGSPGFAAQPVRRLVADRTASGSLLFFTSSCGSDAHVDPAWIFLTENGGATVRPIAVPPGIAATEDGRPAAEQDPIEAIEAPEGSLAHLVLFGQSEQVIGAVVARWESRDGGRSWTPIAPVAAAPEPRSPAVAAGGFAFAIRSDGLYRSRGGGPHTRVYPRE